VPVEFLTDEQAAGYAAYRGAPSRAELERFFFLDDADRELIEGKRRAHNRLGFAVQLCTVRYLGVFLDDPTDVPAEVADYLAEQLDVADPSVLKAYGERENTRLEHVRELRRVLEYKDFSEAEAVLRAWVDARAWTTGEGPKALFDAAAGWLGERRVLLPGVTTLARLVASVREVANQRLWDTLCGLLNVGRRAVLDSLLTVPPGQRISELDQLRRGPVRISGPQMKWALKRAEEIADLGMGEVDVSAIPRGGWPSCPATAWMARRRCCGGTATRVGWRRCWPRGSPSGHCPGKTPSRSSTTPSAGRCCGAASPTRPCRWIPEPPRRSCCCSGCPCPESATSPSTSSSLAAPAASSPPAGTRCCCHCGSSTCCNDSLTRHRLGPASPTPTPRHDNAG